MSEHAGMPAASSVVLADQLADSGIGPAEAAARAELREGLRAALDQLEPLDREALALRHFEQLTSGEAALALGITEKAASKRYLRALERLKAAIVRLGGSM